MHLKLCFLALALFLSESLADKCFECVETVKPNSVNPLAPNTCAGGNLDKNALPVSVRIKDCPAAGCFSSVIDVTKFDYTSYSRGCATADMQDSCKNKNACVCHGDFCNAAGSVKARQAFMGIVAGVLTIVLMQH